MRGYIGYFGLESWWLEELSEQERELIRQRYYFLGASGSGQQNLEEINYTSIGMSNVQFVGGIAGAIQKNGERDLAYKALEKAASLICQETPILDVHFLLHTKIEITYRDADTPEGLQKCVEACLQQIAIAPQAAAAFRAEYKGPLVEHGGYRRLTMLLEHRGDFFECIRICKEALAAGWAGDWEKRAMRCEARQKKIADRDDHI